MKQVVRQYIGEDGIIYLNLEDVARGLGFVDRSKGTDKIIWKRVKKYLCIKNSFRGKDGLPEYITKEQVQKLIQSTSRVIDSYWYELSGLTKSTVILSKEQEVIGFIVECLKDIAQINLQHKVGDYKIDLYIPEYNLAIECDEFGHDDRDCEYEINREEYIKKELDCKFIRFNPDSELFRISELMNTILREII